MTRKEFLAALNKTPRDWKLSYSGAVRRYEYGDIQCPITSLENLHWACWAEIADALGISGELTCQIIAAADGRNNIKHWYLRRQIKKACGL